MDKLRDKFEDPDHSGGKSSGIKTGKYTKKTQTSVAKIEVIFAVIAVIGTLALLLLGQEEAAIGFFPLVWVIYERFTKEEIKKDFKQAQGKTVKAWRVENKK